jgi:hypothetical protein
MVLQQLGIHASFDRPCCSGDMPQPGRVIKFERRLSVRERTDDAMMRRPDLAQDALVADA